MPENVDKVNEGSAPRARWDIGTSPRASTSRCAYGTARSPASRSRRPPGLTRRSGTSSGAELRLEGKTVPLAAGDSWTVPKGASHTYVILEPFTAVEATSPPAEAQGRDEP